MLLNIKMDEFKESKCPFISVVKLRDFSSIPLVDNSLYKQVVGSLLYLTHSWPDLAYTIVVF